MGVGLAISGQSSKRTMVRFGWRPIPMEGPTFSCTLPLITSLFYALADSSLSQGPAVTSPEI